MVAITIESTVAVLEEALLAKQLFEESSVQNI
jgi:hypothetical protein